MPNYDYRCEKCGSTFEVWQKITDPVLESCTAEGCGGKVNRVINAAGFILKGSGWYATDYKSRPNESNSEESKSSKPVSATTEKKESTDSAKKES